MLENAHIVVVDDQPENRMLSLHQLKALSPARLHGVESVPELLKYLALSLQQGQPVDLILMDINMPGIDGIEGTRQVRDIPVCRSIPIIMLTSREDSETLEAAFEAGAVDYVIKTRPALELLTRVRSAYRLKRETDRLKAREQELIELTRKLMDEKQAPPKTSYVDELTGIYHARAFDRIVKTCWEQAYTQARSVGLVLVGLDYFSEYNLHYGREAGDALLKRIAQLLPNSDHKIFSVRFEGSIFAVIVNEDAEVESSHIAERLLSRVRELRLPHDASEVDTIVTVSIGFTVQNPRAEPQLENFLKIARQALIEAGKQGHNRVVEHTSLLDNGPFRLI